MTKYVVIVRRLENGKFMLRFPDFEGITSVAEKDETIEKLAYSVLLGKISEMKEAEVEIPKPMTGPDAAKLLKSDLGEFTTFIIINDEKTKKIKNRERAGININSENMKEQFGNVKEFSSSIKNKMESTLRENINSKNYNLIGILGGIIIAISSLLPIVGAKIPNLFGVGGGTIRFGITNFSDIEKYLAGFEMKKLMTHLIIARIFLILIFLVGIFAAYSYFKNHKIYKDIASKVSLGLIVVFFAYVIIVLSKVPTDLKEFVGMSYAWFGFFIGLILVGVAYFLCYDKNNEENNEEMKFETEEDNL